MKCLILFSTTHNPSTHTLLIYMSSLPATPVDGFVVPAVAKRRAARSRQQRAADRQTQEERNDEVFDRVLAHLVRHRRPLSE